tara:strand:+ start:1156 stop:2217 length:1062 start_codon:yes stop_codon:yes gene_type:complete
MPKRNNARTVRGKGRRDTAVRSMTSSAMSGATSIANSAINRDAKRSRTRRIKKGEALSSMASSMASGMSHVGKMAYDTGMPLARSMAGSVGQSVSKFVSDQRVPRVPNNGVWVDLRHGLITGLINLGIIESDSELPTNVYFQSVERFLDTYKDIMISPHDIKRVTAKLKSMDSDDDGDTRTAIIQDIFKGGITHDTIISALEYEFRNKINSYDDMGIEPEPEPEPGQGFQGAREKTAKKQKMTKILDLSREIEKLLKKINSESKSKYEKGLTPAEIYDIKMKKESDKQDLKDFFKELQDLITMDKELKVLQELVKKYPQLNSMMPAGLKKKMKGKKTKRSGRKRRKRKRTGRR